VTVDDQQARADTTQPDGGTLAMYGGSDLLRQRAHTDPERVFLEIGSSRLTYGELDARVDRLAQWLLDSVGGPDRRIGLHTIGTEALVIAGLGLKRAGMIAVYLDPTAPAPWVGQALADCGAVLLLSDSAQASQAIPCPVVHPCAVGAAPPLGGVHVEPGPIGSIVYTSGSTGEPKGVVISSGQRMARELSQVEGAAKAAGPGGARIGFLGFGSVGFKESLVHLAMGVDATLVGYDLRTEGLQGLGAWLVENRIWAVTAIPTLLRHVLDTLPPDLMMPALKLVALSGEAISWEVLAKLWPHVSTDTAVMISYGCSESPSIAMMVVTASTPAGQGRVPAGRPTSQVAVTIESEDHRPLPEGEVGEIVAWSPRAALGYWNRPEETARRFGTSDDGRSYVRTGDLGRVRPDGLLEHLGRMDDMVKVSGHRVMLSEVEGALGLLPNAAAAAAVSQPDAQGETRIVAYVVPQPGCTLDSAAMRAGLVDRLPPAAVPDRVHIVGELPMLANGKLDRLALRQGVAPPSPRPAGPSDPVDADEITEVVLALWSDILGVEAHEDDDFFALGGDSLRAARLFAEIELQLGADLPLSLLVEASTPRTLAAAIASDAGHNNLVIPIRPTGGRPPLFIVHDLTGSVLFARVIAEQFDDDQPVYAIRGDALLGTVTGAESIQEVAARYVPGVLDTAPDTCALYGSSAGGVIAFELALQLVDKGVDVTFLGLGDSFGPGTEHTALNRGLNPPGRLRLHRRLNDLRAAPWSNRPRLAAGFLWQRSIPAIRHRMAARAQSADGEMARHAIGRSQRDGTPLPRQYRALYGLMHYGPLSVTYRPDRPFDGSISLLRTSDEGSDTRGWSPYATGSIRVLPLPEFHYQLHEEATLRRIGAVLNQVLQPGTPTRCEGAGQSPGGSVKDG
jgi:acyl-coenzyme A synthetase/AMP-(fatty) acid ligase/thioesterase domain-containing protein/acyl carrier protein